jgi:phosphate transport system substrate-binding protein
MVLKGAGSTFDFPVFSAWFRAYAPADPALRFDYQAIGSGGGVHAILARTVDFAASDAPMTNEALAHAPGEILHLPVVMGGVAVVYDLLDGPRLKLDANTLAGIFTGEITKWNDPRIAAVNPDVDLPNYDIVVVHRSDSSGTTFIFTDYLCNVSPVWKSLVGKGMSVNWPVGVGVVGNAGVAERACQLPGAIGYVELSYAKRQELQCADIKNSAGNSVAPSSDSVSAALSFILIPQDFRFSMVNSFAGTAYPICGPSWILMYKQQRDAEKGRRLVNFLKWTVTDGQKLSKAMNYAPLPEGMARQVIERLDQVTFGTAPPVGK